MQNFDAVVKALKLCHFERSDQYYMSYHTNIIKIFFKVEITVWISDFIQDSQL